MSFIVVDVNNEKIGCSVGTEETLKEDGNTAKTMAHPTVLEAQYGVVKVIILQTQIYSTSLYIKISKSINNKI